MKLNLIPQHIQQLQELDDQFDRVCRRLLSANREMDGEYLDYDRRQDAYKKATEANQEMDTILKQIEMIEQQHLLTNQVN